MFGENVGSWFLVFSHGKNSYLDIGRLQQEDVATEEILAFCLSLYILYNLIQKLVR